MIEIHKWDSLSDADRLAILKAAGFKRNLLRLVLSPWRKLPKPKRGQILKVDWRKVMSDGTEN